MGLASGRRIASGSGEIKKGEEELGAADKILGREGDKLRLSDKFIKAVVQVVVQAVVQAVLFFGYRKWVLTLRMGGP